MKNQAHAEPSSTSTSVSTVDPWNDRLEEFVWEIFWNPPSILRWRINDQNCPKSEPSKRKARYTLWKSNWNRTWIDSNISLNFEPNKKEIKYKRSIIRWNHQKKLCWRQMNWFALSKLEHPQHEHKKRTAKNSGYTSSTWLVTATNQINHSTLKPLRSPN